MKGEKNAVLVLDGDEKNDSKDNNAHAYTNSTYGQDVKTETDNNAFGCVSCLEPVAEARSVVFACMHNTAKR